MAASVSVENLNPKMAQQLHKQKELQRVLHCNGFCCSPGLFASI